MHDGIGTEQVSIGLFGTGSRTSWRGPFVTAYQETGIRYFNSQGVDDSYGSYKEAVLTHLAKDRILVFALTGETYGLTAATLIAMAITKVMGTNRWLLVYVEPELTAIDADEFDREEVAVHRALLIGHIGEMDLPNVKLVHNLDDLLQESLRLARDLNQIA
jgi:hypothetical protein